MTLNFSALPTELSYLARDKKEHAVCTGDWWGGPAWVSEETHSPAGNGDMDVKAIMVWIAWKDQSTKEQFPCKEGVVDNFYLSLKRERVKTPFS